MLVQEADAPIVPGNEQKQDAPASRWSEVKA
jgi:hypothetical protein